MMSAGPQHPFSIADMRRLEAAEGWVGLGDWRSAKEELEAIAPELLGHPWVLHRLWDVWSLARDWERALEVATQVTRLKPRDRRGWLNRSFALHELKRTAEAKESLLGVMSRFPKYAVLRYNLACYECRLGNLQAARQLLTEAFMLPGGKELRHNAKEDPDLVELRGELECL